MGAITGLLGTGGGAGGTSFGGPAQASQQGAGNLQTTFNQLQGIANGTGPNPAMAQYNQNVQNIAKQQAGAISSVQGISPALAARMATQQGSAAQQNAAAAGATAQAEQQLGALGQMGQIGTSQQSLANQMQGNINTTNAGLATTTMSGQQGVIGGIGQGVGSILGLAKGGQVQRFAGGGDAFSFGAGPQSSLAKYLQGAGNQGMPQAESAPSSGPAALQKGFASMVTGAASRIKGSGAPENSGQGPTAASASQMGAGIPYAQPMTPGFAAGGQTDFRSGGNVKARAPAQKAVKSGNSYANDKIPALLSEGEVVIPRSVMQSRNPPAAAMRFVQAVMSKRGKR